MPPVGAFILTHRLPCALLLLMMQTAVLWLPRLSMGIASLALVLSLLALLVHLASPALVGLVALGGGLKFALQTSVIAAVGIGILSGLDWMPAMASFALYGLIPAFTALLLVHSGGLERSARAIALAMTATAFMAIYAGAMSQGVSLQEFARQLLTPMFDALQPATGDAEVLAALQQAQEMTARILPGMVALGLWAIWWGDILIARAVAQHFGFYKGDNSSALLLRFSKALALAFVILSLIPLTGEGNWQYLSANAAIVVAGLLATQGIMVVHYGLKAKSMRFAIVLMYLMLFLWSAMILPFVIVGLLDIWFDFRRRIFPANGGQ